MKLFLTRIVLITLGAFIAAFALESFLVPNQIIDGGVVGISIMASYITKMQLGLFLFAFNIPFIILALHKFGKMFVFLTFYAVSMLSIFVTLVSGNIGLVTKDLLLASVFGGLFLGTGVGLVLKNNASLDGTEILAIRITKKAPFSVGEIIMFFNIFIFVSAGFLFGWDRAMYSALTYFTAFRVIDIVLQGFNEAKSIFIVSDKPDEIGRAIMENFDRSVTYIQAEGGYSGVKKKMIYCVIKRIEIVKIKETVNNIDPEAFIAIENVHEVDGKRYKKKAQ